jgi:hypothetical protein
MGTVPVMTQELIANMLGVQRRTHYHPSRFSWCATDPRFQ